MGLTRRELLKTLAVGGGSVLLGTSLPTTHLSGSVTIPPKLSTGDTIGMISPASSLPEYQSYAKVVKKIEGLGFKVKVSDHAKGQFGYFASTDKNRAKDLNSMFADSEVDGIMPFRGGWGCNRILKYIDFELIADNPKPLVGFSDITTLLLAIYSKSGLVSYHGPMGTSNWGPFTTSHFQQSLMQTDPFMMKNTIGNIETITGGKASGPILGGNLTVLTAMIGSDYLPDWNDTILFVEEVGEEIYRIDRMLTQLKLAGVLDKVNGFIFGICTGCQAEPGPHFSLQEIVTQHVGHLDIPVYMGANIGHIDKMITVPVGAQAEMDADKGSIRLLEPPVV